MARLRSSLALPYSEHGTCVEGELATRAASTGFEFEGCFDTKPAEMSGGVAIRYQLKLTAISRTQLEPALGWEYQYRRSSIT
jgi:hypothetical protein